MLPTDTCRKILEAAGANDLSDGEIARLRDLLVLVARLWLRDEFGLGETPPAQTQ